MDVTKLRKMQACNEALEWASQQRSRQQAWDDCPRSDWMLWLLARRVRRQGSAAHRKLVLCACAVARTALARVPSGEDRPRKAIETAEAWARREGPTLDDVRSAGRAAYAVAVASANVASGAAAYASAVAYANVASARAVYASASAARCAADAESRQQVARIVRQFYPWAPRI